MIALATRCAALLAGVSARLSLGDARLAQARSSRRTQINWLTGMSTSAARSVLLAPNYLARGHRLQAALRVSHTIGFRRVRTPGTLH